MKKLLLCLLGLISYAFTQNVGIGTTTPTAKLQIVQPDAANALQVDDVASDTSPFVIDADGNVGIQTATPAFNLDVSATGARARVGNMEMGTAPSNASWMLLGHEGLDHSTQANAAVQQAVGGFTVFNTAPARNMSFRIGNTPAMQLQANGNFGIGNSNPQFKLDVTGDANIGDSLTMGGNILMSGNWVSNDGADEGMFVATDGSVGIGTATPGSTLDVNGDATIGTTLTMAGGNILMNGNWVSNDGGNEGVYVMANGRVGIGTASPALLFHVNGSARIDLALVMNGGNIWMGSNWLTGDGDNEGVYVNFNGNVGIGTNTPGSLLDVNGSASVGTTLNVGTTLTMDTDNILMNGQWLSNDGDDEGVFVNIDGEVGIGNSNPQVRLHVAGVIRTGSHFEMGAESAYFASNLHFASGTWNYNTNGYGWVIRHDANGRMQFANTPSGTAGGTTTLDTRMVLENNGRVAIKSVTPQELFHVGINGDGTAAIANSWTTFSDRRYKKDFAIIDNPIGKVQAMNGYYYYWKDESQDKSRQVGVVAQEIEEILPELVRTHDNGYKAVDYPKLTAVLIEAVKDQQKQIDELKAALEQNQSDISDLKAEINKSTQR